MVEQGAHFAVTVGVHSFQKKGPGGSSTWRIHFLVALFPPHRLGALAAKVAYA
jgi:hypothetical protein